MKSPLLVGLLIAACSSITSAQVPDFSGTWRVVAPPEPPATTPPTPPRGDMGSGWGPQISVTQSPAELVILQPLFSRYDLQPPLRFVYALGGDESRNTVMAGHATQTRVSRAAWDGQAIRIVTRYPGVDPDTGKPFESEVTQRLSLSSPTELVIETFRRGALGGRDITTRTVYRKDP